MKLKPLIPFHCLYINSYFYLLLNVFLHTISITRCVDDIFFSFDRFSFGHTHTHSVTIHYTKAYFYSLWWSLFDSCWLFYVHQIDFEHNSIGWNSNEIGFVWHSVKQNERGTSVKKKKKVYRKLSLSIKRGQIKYSKEYFQQLHLQCYFVIYSSEIIYFCKHI